MKFPWNPRGPLEGAAVFLSASVPDLSRDDRFLRGPVEDRLLMNRVIDLRALDAVRSLVAQTLRAGGRILHGGHPTITPAIACHADNWELSGQQQRPVQLYQSSVFRDKPAPAGREAMLEAEFADVRWTPATLEEATLEVGPLRGQPLLRWLKEHNFDDGWREHTLAVQGPETLREPLLVMRLLMLLEEQPRACLCIGGMEGIEAEAKLYLKLVERGLLLAEPRVHVLGSTFGAAVQLEDQRSQLMPEPSPTPTTPQTAEQDLLRRVVYDETMRQFVRHCCEVSRQW